MNTNIFTDLKDALSGVGALKGNIFPTAAPENAGLPHCVYVQTKKEDILALDKPTGLSEYTITLHIAAERYSDLIAVCAAAKQAVTSMPHGNSRCLAVDWKEPNSEAYETQWGVQRRSPTLTIFYYD